MSAIELRLRTVGPSETREVVELFGLQPRTFRVPVWTPTPESTRLRERRVTAGFGLREAAQLAGVSATSWSALESGRAVPADGDWRPWFAVLEVDDGD